jgi:hypothetical protein
MQGADRDHPVRLRPKHRVQFSVFKEWTPMFAFDAITVDVTAAAGFVLHVAGVVR